MMTEIEMIKNHGGDEAGDGHDDEGQKFVDDENDADSK